MKKLVILAVLAGAAEFAVAGWYLEVDPADSSRANLSFEGLSGTAFVGSLGGAIDKYPPPPIIIEPPLPWAGDPFVSFYVVEVGLDPKVPPQPHSGLVAYFTTADVCVDVYLFDGDTFEGLGMVHLPEPASLCLLGLGGLVLRRRS